MTTSLPPQPANAPRACSRRDMLKLTGAGIALCGAGPLSAVAALAEDTFRCRTLKSGLKLSTVGIGGGNLKGVSGAEVARVIALAREGGVNFIDMLMPPDDMTHIAAAIRGQRERFALQLHLGTRYFMMQYSRSRNAKLMREIFEPQLKLFGGYTDIALLHYIDQADDFERVINDGLFEYAIQLKKAGAIRNLGFSTHSVDIARRFLELGVMDVFMFSINPVYDFDKVDGRITILPERAALYRESTRRGVGIVGMKTYGGGRLLNARTTPVGRVMTPPQCIQYALDRPAVVSCPVGVSNAQEMQAALAYYTASRAERSYAFIGSLQDADVQGNCVYCNHCLPCPANIDIGAAIKYYDLAQIGDETARDHYRQLARHANDCVYCGACEKNCPFQVRIMDTMRAMKTFFG